MAGLPFSLREPQEDVVDGNLLAGLGGSLRWSVVDLDPVAVRVLKVDLPNAIGSDRSLPRHAREILVGNPKVGQLPNGLVEARSRQRKVGGPRSARWNLSSPEDQVDGTTRAEPEPPDVRACGLFLNFRKSEDLRIEPGACVQVVHEQRDVVQLQCVRHEHQPR